MFPLSKIEPIISRMLEDDPNIWYELHSNYSIVLTYYFENGKLELTYIGRGYAIKSDVSYFPHDCLDIYFDTIKKLTKYMEEIREVIEATGEVDFDESEYPR